MWRTGLVSNGAIYGPSNQRVMDADGYFYLYGEAGELLGKYQLNWGVNSVAYIQDGPRVYFAGRMLADTAHGWAMTDRLGSVRLNQNGERSNYQPYGAEITSTSQNRTKFGTYWRDSSGLDYANQRYYANAVGRFLTADRGRGVDRKDPGSWNKYAYTGGDPINFNDPPGTNAASVSNPGYCDVSQMYCGGSFWDPTNGVGGGGGGGGIGMLPQAWVQYQLAAYNQMVNDAMSAAQAHAFDPPDPNCVQDAITTAANATRLGLTGFTDPWVQIVGSANPNGGGVR